MLLLAPSIIVLIDFIKFLIVRKRLFRPLFSRIIEIITITGLPLLYLWGADYGMGNDCCTESATFSPEHKLTIYVWIGICIATYIYSTIRKEICPPVLEVLINCILVIGLVLNGFIGYQIIQPLWLIGNLPIGLLFIINLYENQQRVLELADKNKFNLDSWVTRNAWKLLNSKAFVKYPILLVLTLPIIVLITSVLILFGQKPDSIIQAFTQTYKHGFSELDHLCENVECGGHYLCSVAANGHEKIVNPQRYGLRNGKLIICNRQLLISNAFEDIIFERAPSLHKLIRRNYNKVGNLIHKYYYVFENKLVSDITYFIMKPFEWLFLLTLYIHDKNPENRIEIQYLKDSDKTEIKNTLQQKL